MSINSGTFCFGMDFLVDIDDAVIGIGFTDLVLVAAFSIVAVVTVGFACSMSFLARFVVAYVNSFSEFVPVKLLFLPIS